MRILFLAPLPPWPLTQGRNLRNFHLLQHLSRHHTVDLVTGGTELQLSTIPSSITRHWNSLQAFPWPQRGLRQRLVDAIHPQPDLWRAHTSQPLIDACVRLYETEGFEIIHVAGFEMHGCARQVQQALPAAVPMVLDEQNIEFSLQESLHGSKRGSWLDPAYGIYRRMQSAKTRRHEARAWRESRHVLTVSPEDRAHVLKILSADRVVLVPNGLDTDSCPAVDHGQREPHHLLFMGKMDYRPNVLSMMWFCQHVLPQLTAIQPDTRLTILGRDPSPEILALDLIPEVTVTGYVDDVAPYMRKGSVFVVPMFHGGGTRFKVLEAFMAGMPLVSTTLGVAGVPLDDGTHYWLADNARDFATAIERCWSDPEHSRSMAQRGRELVMAEFDWKSITRAMTPIYADASDAKAGI